ncbi:CBS domain-containing protein, partial [Candidatus Woesearchaeota archaeon]|nr:CBS domain-containing protein [Candidatus Woesearchaeota archaeon]
MKPEQEYNVRDFMKTELVEVNPETSVKKVAEIMAEKHVSSAIVAKEKAIAGIITEKDLARKIVAKGLDAEKVTAKDIMTVDLVTVNPETSLYDAMLKLNEKKITHLPVVRENKIVGIITSMDILRVQPSYMEILAGP